MEALESTRQAERRELLLRLLESRVALNETHVARQIGINDRTLRRWKADDPEFARRLEEARELARQNAVHSYENKASSLALDGDSQLLKFLLTAHKPDRYRPDSKGPTNNGTVINIGQLTVCPRDGDNPLELVAEALPEATDT